MPLELTFCTRCWSSGRKVLSLCEEIEKRFTKLFEKAAVGKCSDLNLKWRSSSSILRTSLFYAVLYVQAALSNFVQRQLHIFAFPHIWRAPVWPYLLMTKASVTTHQEYEDLQFLIKFQQISSCVMLRDSEPECTSASSTQQFGRVFGHAASLKAGRQQPTASRSDTVNHWYVNRIPQQCRIYCT